MRKDELGRVLTWRDVLVLSLGSALLVNVSIGPMAVEIGAAAVVVWSVTALVGLAQCLMIAQLACQSPGRSGGVPAYIHDCLKHRSPLFGVTAAWAYWTGWIPGVAAHLTLAAAYIKAAFWPQANSTALVVALWLGLYTLNYFGVRLLVWTSGVMAVCALVPLGAILSAPLFSTGWSPPDLWSLASRSVQWQSPAGLLLAAKWAFVAVWSSYGGEMAATLAGELRDPECDSRKMIALAGLATFVSFTVVPIALLGSVGAHAFAQEPYVVFLTAARGIFGTFGTAIVSVMLIAALLTGAQLFVISSSRALYQMSKDGLTIASLQHVNRYKVPVGSIAWDAAVTLALIAIFRNDVVDVVAAANVGYVIVFVMLPWAYLESGALGRPAELAGPRVMSMVARLVFALNLMLLIVGGSQWGVKVMGVGLALLAVGIPLYRVLDKTQALRKESAVVLSNR